MTLSNYLRAALICGVALMAAACGKSVATETPSGTGPVKTAVEPDLDSNNFKVDHRERFPLVTAGEHTAAPELNVTGVVSPDVSRQVPVPSLATGRIVEINARLGDEVKKGQLLFKVRSTDVSGAFSDYLQAVKNEQLTQIQLNRANILLEHGAIPRSQQEIAQTSEDNAVVILNTTKEHLTVLGSDPDHPSGIVEVFAPVSGTITDQQITNQSGVQALTAPSPFTISDLASVWIVCDVWENDISRVHIGEFADIRIAAYPNRVLKGRINNILPIVDPNIRTAKVRIEVENPGMLRLGMFVTATFHGETMERRATVPSSAILHLHDRQWVYTPMANGRFQRREVKAGNMLPDNLQEVIRGLTAGDQVVANALTLQNTLEQ
jgi:cobalt-zinc-cadmium efflux system membrane fusion protein